MGILISPPYFADLLLKLPGDNHKTKSNCTKTRYLPSEKRVASSLKDARKSAPHKFGGELSSIKETIEIFVHYQSV
jgi:hypothetical protein